MSTRTETTARIVGHVNGRRITAETTVVYRDGKKTPWVWCSDYFLEECGLKFRSAYDCRVHAAMLEPGVMLREGQNDTVPA